jgi:hypothetical protein
MRFERRGLSTLSGGVGGAATRALAIVGAIVSLLGTRRVVAVLADAAVRALVGAALPAVGATAAGLRP